MEKIGLSCGPKAIALSLKLWTSHLQRLLTVKPNAEFRGSAVLRSLGSPTDTSRRQRSHW
jgi:hypothetical protein